MSGWQALRCAAPRPESPAKTSLAETERRLTVEQTQLKIALELAEDAALVYASAEPTTKRGYNQAFFVRLYVVARAGRQRDRASGAVC